MSLNNTETYKHIDSISSRNDINIDEKRLQFEALQLKILLDIKECLENLLKKN